MTSHSTAPAPPAPWSPLFSRPYRDDWCLRFWAASCVGVVLWSGSRNITLGQGFDPDLFSALMTEVVVGFFLSFVLLALVPAWLRCGWRAVPYLWDRWLQKELRAAERVRQEPWRAVRAQWATAAPLRTGLRRALSGDDPRPDVDVPAVFSRTAPEFTGLRLTAHEVLEGGSVTVAWRTEGATHVTVSGNERFWPPNGQLEVLLPRSQEIVVTAWNGRERTERRTGLVRVLPWLEQGPFQLPASAVVHLHADVQVATGEVESVLDRFDRVAQASRDVLAEPVGGPRLADALRLVEHSVRRTGWWPGEDPQQHQTHHQAQHQTEEKAS